MLRGATAGICAWRRQQHQKAQGNGNNLSAQFPTPYGSQVQFTLAVNGRIVIKRRLEAAGNGHASLARSKHKQNKIRFGESVSRSGIPLWAPRKLRDFPASATVVFQSRRIPDRAADVTITWLQVGHGRT
jgi:hypothetical protein